MPAKHRHDEFHRGLVPTDQLGTGSADDTVFLRGDETWAPASGGTDPDAIHSGDAAGGELGGTYPNPTVDATHGGSAHHDPVTVGTGLDVTGQLVELDLSEVAAGGELDGFMDAPTVDATHSGSTHAAAAAAGAAAAEAYSDGTLAAHAGAADPHPGYTSAAELAAYAQPLDADLSAFAALAIDTDTLPYGTGSHTLGLTALTTAGRALIDDADAAAQRATLGLGTAAIAATGDFEAAGTAVLKTVVNAKGDLISATADNAPSIVTVGADDTILMADAAAASGLKWVASASPSAVGTAAAIGTADTFTRGDHVHAHEAAHVAHDTLWDTAGDLVQASGADAAAKLAIIVPAANILNVLGVVNGETLWSVKAVHDATVPVTQALADAAAAGTALTASHRDHKHGMPSALSVADSVAAARSGAAFPGSPAAGDEWERTDIRGGTRFRYDGTRWLSVEEFSISFTSDVTMPTTIDASALRAVLGMSPTYDNWVTEVRCVSQVNGTNNSGNHWAPLLGLTGTSFSTSGDSGMTSHIFPVNALTGTSVNNTYLEMDKVGAPGSLYLFATLFFRIVGP